MHNDVRNPDDDTRLHASKRLRLLADVWPALDAEERGLLESQLHQLREQASS